MAWTRLGAHEFAIGGHRGCGENLLSRGSKAGQGHCKGARENTLASFRNAVDADVDFIEFDVQVTSDGVPIIWHDDYIVHGSLCAPKRSLVSQLTLQEIKSIGPLLRWFKDATTHLLLPCDFAWICDEEDSIPTLVEVFEQVPEHIGFNIEIKLATSAALAQTPQSELERINGAIVNAIASCSGSRTLAVSSFDPDIMSDFLQYSSVVRKHCAELTTWFLTSGSRELVHVDARRRSVKEAAAIAHGLGLSGIVVESTLLQTEHADVVAAMHDGLKVMSYGLANNDPAFVLEQRAAGVVGVIADDVHTIVSCARGDMGGGSPTSTQDTLVGVVLAAE